VTQEILVKSDTESAGLAPYDPCRSSRRIRPLLQFEAMWNNPHAFRPELGPGSRRIMDGAFERTRSVREADYASMRVTVRHVPPRTQKLRHLRTMLDQSKICAASASLPVQRLSLCFYTFRTLSFFFVEVTNQVYPTLWDRFVRDVLTLSAQRLTNAMQ
jgi:hypothetical protein